MTAFHPLGPLVGLRPKAAIPWTMAPRARGLHCIVRRPHAHLRPSISTALIVAATGLTPAACLAITGRRGPRRQAVAAPAPLPKEQRLQPLERDLCLTQRRQQPRIRPQHPIQQPPVLLLPTRRAEPLPQ